MPHDPLRLLAGVELLGRVERSGLREAPYYVRRSPLRISRAHTA